MSQQRHATAKARGDRAAQSGRSRARADDHSTRNVILAVVGAIVILAALGYGAALVYDQTSGSSGSLTQEDAQATAVGGNDARAAKVSKYLNENYADTTWYSSVLSYEGDGSKIILKTNLSNIPFGVSRAAKMCDAVSDYIYGDGATDAEFTSIEIRDVKNKNLVTRPNRGTVCTEVGS